MVLQSAPGVFSAVTVRGSIMWALKQLPANLFHDPSIWGLDSRLRLSVEDLFWGILSKRDRLGGVLEGGRGGKMWKWQLGCFRTDAKTCAFDHSILKPNNCNKHIKPNASRRISQHRIRPAFPTHRPPAPLHRHLCHNPGTPPRSRRPEFIPSNRIRPSGRRYSTRVDVCPLQC